MALQKKFVVEVRREEILGESMFPLPLVAIEKFMVWDDRPEYPKTYRVAIQFEGELDESLLVDSFRIAIRRQPLLCAYPREQRNELLWDLPEVAVFPFFESDVGFEQGSFPKEEIAGASPGLRIWYTRGNDRSEIVLDFHHANTDGIGGRNFCRDWFWCYRELYRACKEVPKLPTIDPERLLKRGQFARLRNEEVQATSLWQKAYLAWLFHALGPHAMERPSTQLGSDNARWKKEEASRICAVNHVRIEFDPMDTSLMVKEVEALNLNLNEWMIGKFVSLIADWNRKHSSANSHRIRIMVPTSLRGSRENRLPAANRLGFGFVSVAQQRCRNFTSILQETLEQTRAIRKYQLGVDFVEQFSVATRMPWLVKRILSSKSCFATAVLTNLGNNHNRFHSRFGEDAATIRAGNLSFRAIIAAPPIRYGTHLGMGVCMNNDRLTVGLATDLPVESIVEQVRRNLLSNRQP